MQKELVISIATVYDGNFNKLSTFISKVSQYLKTEYLYYEILIINNGIILQNYHFQKLVREVPNTRVITLSKKYPFYSVQGVLLDKIIGDIVCLLDYRKDSTSSLKKMVSKIKNGYDAVIIKDKVSNISLTNKLLLQMCSFLGKLLTGLNVPFEWTDTCGYTRKSVNRIIQLKTRSNNIKYINIEAGFKVGEILQKNEGEKTISPKKAVSLILSTIRLAKDNSNYLLRLISKLTLLGACANIVYIIYVVLINLFKPNVAEGWTTISLATAFMFAMLFLVLGTIGEYIAHIYQQISGASWYHVVDELHASTALGNEKRKNVTNK